MIQISRFKVFLILLVCLYGVFYTLPNVVGSETRQWMVDHLPYGFPKQTVNLGLDLRGGAHLVYQVDLDKVFVDRSDMLQQDFRTQLREDKVPYDRLQNIDKGVRIVLKDAADIDKAKAMIRRSDRRLVITTGADGVTLDVTMDSSYIKEVQDQTIAQVIEVVRRRIDELGTTEPMIARQGTSRVIIQAPGANASELRRLVGRTAKLGFYLVSDQTHRTAGDISLPMADNETHRINVKRRAMITGDMLDGAQPSFNQNGQTVVDFRLNAAGARKFCDVTRNHTGEPFAIVLDQKVISAPRINEPICGGRGQISGGFTVQEASDLALLLRAGALPADMEVVEERSVGPSLGADSIASGKEASLIALVLVLVFMAGSYGLFGLMADVALLFNVALIMAILSSLQATLTLPGIAGIVLTIGMAVDANVLIFERIREEFKAGRSAISSIDAGYSRAMTTIIDANLTTLIAGLILFMVGTGPVKGFAVTLGVGIITSYFSAIMITRLMVVWWLQYKRPTDLPI